MSYCCTAILWLSRLWNWNIYILFSIPLSWPLQLWNDTEMIVNWKRNPTLHHVYYGSTGCKQFRTEVYIWWLTKNKYSNELRKKISTFIVFTYHNWSARLFSYVFHIWENYSLERHEIYAVNNHIGHCESMLLFSPSLSLLQNFIKWNLVITSLKTDSKINKWYHRSSTLNNFKLVEEEALDIYECKQIKDWDTSHEDVL